MGFLDSLKAHGVLWTLRLSFKRLLTSHRLDLKTLFGPLLEPTFGPFDPLNQ